MRRLVSMFSTATLALAGGIGGGFLGVDLGGGFGAAQGAELKVGDTAPEFELVGTDGKKHKLSSYVDKRVVVVAWFPKAFTGGCTAECKSMRASGEALRKTNAAYFTASVDTAEDNKKFAESLELDYPILSDPTKATAKAYGVLNIERDLPYRWTFYIGPERKILFIDKSVRTGSHGDDIAAKLKELAAK